MKEPGWVGRGGSDAMAILMSVARHVVCSASQYKVCLCSNFYVELLSKLQLATGARARIEEADLVLSDFCAADLKCLGVRFWG